MSSSFGAYSPMGMGGLMKKEKKKAKAPGIEAVPQESDPAVIEAARAEAEMLKKKKGWRASLITGAQGVTTTASTEKTLLGQ